MVTTSKGHNQSQKVKAPGKLIWLNIWKIFLPVRAVQLWKSGYLKVYAPSPETRLYRRLWL